MPRLGRNGMASGDTFTRSAAATATTSKLASMTDGKRVG